MSSRLERRRKAILGRVRKALDAFYLLQQIDWDYDLGTSFDKVLELALSELTLDESGEDRGEGETGKKRIERALLVIRTGEQRFEAEAGWAQNHDKLEFSKSVIDEVMTSGNSLLCQDAFADERFAKSKSVRDLSLASFLCVPIAINKERVGAFLFATSSADHPLNEDDQAFLEEFVNVVSPYLKTAILHKIHVETIQAAESEPAIFHGLHGVSTVMHQLFDQIRLMAGTDATVFIQGETGTGKRRVARAIHAASDRAEGPFLTVSCAASSGIHLESEIFGHRRGAFEGAEEDRDGLALKADGGTLFLENVAEIDLPVQAKLLAFLQNPTVRPVGSDQTQKVDVRVLASTHQILKAQVNQGTFREDLYYHLNVLALPVPPLRERVEDIPVLALHFLQELREQGKTQVTEISPGALDLLSRRRWPGNVRELEHTIGHAALLAKSSILGEQAISPEQVEEAPPLSSAEEKFELSLEDVRRARGESGECEYVKRALAQVRERASGRVELVEQAVSLIADCSAPTLRRRIKKLNINLGEYVGKLSGKRPRRSKNKES